MERILRVSKTPVEGDEEPDVCVIELGGTIGMYLVTNVCK